MNHMKEVAQLLGVELYEEFYIKNHRGTRYRITENGTEQFFGEWMKADFINDLIRGKHEIIKIKSPILDEVEKQYLSNIVRPFRNNVEWIIKRRWENYEYIVIAYYDGIVNDEYELEFPAFKVLQMYKGMEPNRRYSLEELDL